MFVANMYNFKQNGKIYSVVCLYFVFVYSIEPSRNFLGGNMALVVVWIFKCETKCVTSAYTCLCFFGFFFLHSLFQINQNNGILGSLWSSFIFCTLFKLCNLYELRTCFSLSLVSLLMINHLFIPPS